MRHLLLILALSPYLASAVDVLYTDSDPNIVIIRQEKGKPYVLGETVCLEPGKDSVKCGKVIKVTSRDATLFLNLRAEGIQVLTTRDEASKK